MASIILEWFARIFNPILDPALGFLLNLPPVFGILIITFLVTLITTLIYKKTTDQEILKSIKEEMKDIRKQMKEFQHDASKVAELQKISMQKSMIQMKQTMKPMLITMIPVLIIFGWFATHLAYNPILPDQEFSADLFFKSGVSGDVKLIVPSEIEIIGDGTKKVEDGKAAFTMKGKSGEYNLEFVFNNKTYTKDILITAEKKYKSPELIINEDLKMIKINNKPIQVFGLSWFWAYIIFAILFNTLLRKLLKVH